MLEIWNGKFSLNKKKVLMFDISKKWNKKLLVYFQRNVLEKLDIFFYRSNSHRAF